MAAVLMATAAAAAATSTAAAATATAEANGTPATATATATATMPATPTINPTVTAIPTPRGIRENVTLVGVFAKTPPPPPTLPAADPDSVVISRANGERWNFTFSRPPTGGLACAGVVGFVNETVFVDMITAPGFGENFGDPGATRLVLPSGTGCTVLSSQRQ